MAALTLLSSGFVAGAALSALALFAARRAKLLAIPNARSSHERPTPTGGGVAIVVPVLAWCAWHAFASPFAAAILLGGGALAVLGFVDDVVQLSARTRFVVHVAAVIAVVVLLPLPVFEIPPLRVAASWLAWPIFAFVLLWLVNLYNFMDGIDALATAQCITFVAGAIGLGASGEAAAVAWLLGGAAAGFLIVNLPPARIFMGDVASGFLGLTLGVIALAVAHDAAVPFVASMVLLTGFWFDASWTLCARIATGQPFTAAHRSHLYQKCARRFGHGRTTTGAIVLNLLWLTPLAFLARDAPTFTLLWLALAMLPYAVGCVTLRAGMPERALAEGGSG